MLTFFDNLIRTKTVHSNKTNLSIKSTRSGNINSQNKIDLIKIKKYISMKLMQKLHNDYNPNTNNIKYLVIIACHCESETKLTTISNNLRYFDFTCAHKIIINTCDLSYNQQLKEICNLYSNTKYVEIENSPYVDFGKWTHILKDSPNYTDYDYVVLTNDSFFIHDSINHFFNLTAKHAVDLFGYNDSTQSRYHYQSYLFSLKVDVIPIFIRNVNNPHFLINSQKDVINNFETQMTDWFSSVNCFLKIGQIPMNIKKNIFFTNDKLYLPLKNNGLLPFTKLKRKNIHLKTCENNE